MFGADGPVILQLLWPHFSSQCVTSKSAGALALNCLPLLPSCGQYLSGSTFLASLNSFSAPEQMLLCFFLHSQVVLIRLVDHISRCWAAALLLAPATPAVPFFFSGYQWGFPDRDDDDDHDDHNDHSLPCARIAWHLPPLTWGSQLSLVVPWTNSAGLITAGTTYIASDSHPCEQTCKDIHPLLLKLHRWLLAFLLSWWAVPLKLLWLPGWPYLLDLAHPIGAALLPLPLLGRHRTCSLATMFFAK